MHPFLSRMIRDRRTVDLDGTEREVTGGIAEHEAAFIMAAIKQHNVRYSMETGVAFGVSTVAICEALSRLGGDRKHWGIDPCQHSEFNGAALAALNQCGFSQQFELLEGPSHAKLPHLLERGIELDLVFIDGWHTFDYTLLDVFYADKMLRPGGLLLMHDMQMPSKRKVWNFLRTHRKYRRLRGPRRSAARCIYSAAEAAVQLNRDTVVPAFGELFGYGGLLVAQKIATWEPPFHFYRSF